MHVFVCKKGYELLNCNDHKHVHKKMKRDFRDSRPDITHQARRNPPLMRQGGECVCPWPAPSRCAPRPPPRAQTLLTLLDSPLNKAGYLKIYIHTENNILIEVPSLPTFRVAGARASGTRSARSVATTRAPSRASTHATSPAPQPSSTTRAPAYVPAGLRKPQVLNFGGGGGAGVGLDGLLENTTHTTHHTK